ncbi:glycerophosphodiester phosphodiesterase 1-like [Bombyx mandarina]|uniref:Glycerophosphodiester phosphodiesterase 1-like n=1 Tax=Bombyx mandarina TaxID=7092 RepID=A0A6J2JGK1_BOMMA|nr:glycerophosphodiester phosphodiesterase 1-like [Bombyx mandarina]
MFSKLYTMCQMFWNNMYYLFSFINLLIIYVHLVLPFGLDVGLAFAAMYYITALERPDKERVQKIFGHDPWSKEEVKNSEEVVHCIAHRGAALDAPENTIEAFKYCVEQNCKFVEMDVRSLRDGQLVLLHDEGLQRLTGTTINNVQCVDWDAIKDYNVAANHPNREHFKDVRLCLFEDALDYLLENKFKMIIDVKGVDQEVISGVLDAFASRPALYESAAVTCFNPYPLYLIRKTDPKIVGALSYRPYCFSAQDYDAENGPTNPRFPDSVVHRVAMRACDALHGVAWRRLARWCGVSAVLLHKDIVSPSEVEYWRGLGVRCVGWAVNRPVEKLYWRGVLRAAYLASTLLGEPAVEKQSKDKTSSDCAASSPEQMLDPEQTEQNVSSGRN